MIRPPITVICDGDSASIATRYTAMAKPSGARWRDISPLATQDVIGVCPTTRTAPVACAKVYGGV